jgi:hypothetical protein
VSRDLVGFRALGRQGELGVVVDVADGLERRARELVVRGGVTAALVYFVPETCVRAIASERRTLVCDVDVTDFVPTLHVDGTVELRIGRA